MIRHGMLTSTILAVNRNRTMLTVLAEWYYTWAFNGDQQRRAAAKNRVVYLHRCRTILSASQILAVNLPGTCWNDAHAGLCGNPTLPFPPMPTHARPTPWHRSQKPSQTRERGTNMRGRLAFWRGWSLRARKAPPRLCPVAIKLRNVYWTINTALYSSSNTRYYQ